MTGFRDKTLGFVHWSLVLSINSCVRVLVFQW